MLSVFFRIPSLSHAAKAMGLTLNLLILILFPVHEWGVVDILASGDINRNVAKIIDRQHYSEVEYLFAGNLNMDTTAWFIKSNLRSIHFSSSAFHVLTKNEEQELISETIHDSRKLLISRVANKRGFPTDSAQEIYNQMLNTFVNQGDLKKTKIGGYFLWTRQL